MSAILRVWQQSLLLMSGLLVGLPIQMVFTIHLLSSGTDQAGMLYPAPTLAPIIIRFTVSPMSHQTKPGLSDPTLAAICPKRSLSIIYLLLPNFYSLVVIRIRIARVSTKRKSNPIS